jgi:hypothetical protein
MKAACCGNLRKSVIVALFLLIASIAVLAQKYLPGDGVIDRTFADETLAPL